jgi:hypothetical protein
MFDLPRFMQARERLQRVSVERCVSGLALPGIYAFLAQRSPQVRFSGGVYWKGEE